MRQNNPAESVKSESSKISLSLLGSIDRTDVYRVARFRQDLTVRGVDIKNVTWTARPQLHPQVGRDRPGGQRLDGCDPADIFVCFWSMIAL